MLGCVGSQFALLLLALLSQAESDPVLVDLGSRAADWARWLGINISGLFVDSTRYTVASLDELPTRPFDFLFFDGTEVLQKFLDGLISAPGLVTARTRFIVLQDRQTFGILQHLFPGQVFWGWMTNDLVSDDAPNELRHLPALHITADPQDPAFLLLAENFHKAGLLCVIEQTQAEVSKSDGLHSRTIQTTAAATVQFLNFKPFPLPNIR